MRTIAIIAVLLLGCEHPPQQAAKVVAIDAAQWEVKATDWPLGEERVCVFNAFENGMQPFAGCWEEYDQGQFHNRGDHSNDHQYLMKASLPENVKQALAEGHNQKAFCVRDEYMHLSCPKGGSLK